MAKFLDVDPSDLSIFDSIDRVITIRAAKNSPSVNEELTLPLRRLVHPAFGVSHVSVERSGASAEFVLDNFSRALLIDADENLRIQDQSADAVLIILESKSA